ncbi:MULTISPECIES: energy transducer TonB [Paraburkholderia]|uniref:Protein TonB n=1 Tax=Paraburkholderia tropica TaxID=92647 RepID=A0A1A5XA79_9BURK|nr:energy transducer TonB [Paraburkholderia tropica]MBB2979543.1 protein TonB [Paraburkholderia tropica]MBB2999963.1 protein TonB [Paraburkholderia tropica]MBB6319593.1 protein TonB [Paraburkholderia tropica]MDE1142937.1 energy transducer TonB [Paraburkholderia tropica]OBR50229.1 energy transducer TonB [Paraburkholderia tropica]
MQATQTTASALSYPAVRTNRRVVTASAIVIALHAALIAVVLMKRDAVTPVALESQTITAELIKPEPVAAPAAIQSTPTPPPPKPVPVKREKPKVQPKPKPTPTPPLPVADAPSQHVVETPAPSQPAPPAPTPPAPAAQAAPAVGKPTMALTAPKNVSHLECNIVKPDYPTLSRRRGETGTAYVHFVVGLTGKIENIELKKSSGYSRLDDAAMGAMRDSSCKPYLEDGQPVRAAYTQPFGFTLDD